MAQHHAPLMTSYFIGSQVGGVVMCGRGFAGSMWPSFFFSFFFLFLLVSIIQLEGGATVVTTGYKMSVK